MTAVLGAAAIAFDTGMVLLEKRIKQNAADAAALAGARFLPGDTATAAARAHAIAGEHNFEHGVDGVSVTVGFPSSGRIEVRISDSHKSIFAGIFGIDDWNVGARAVAANVTSSGGGFAMLALDPDACPGIEVEGTGTIRSNGNIHVNSTCNTGDGAFRVAGSGGLYLEGDGIGCNIAEGGEATYGGGVAHNDCNPANEHADVMPDPYASKNYPLRGVDAPEPPAPIELVSGTGTVPDACPGGAAQATHDAPATCLFGGSYDGTTWRLHPGYYPGGLDLGGGNFLLEPGIYIMGGGGFRVANAGVLSVDGGDTVDYGVMIFNTTHPTFPADQVVLQGGEAAVRLYPLQMGTEWDNFVIFQDRSLTLTVEIVGGDSDLELRGIIYAPSAHIQVQGNAGTMTFDQLIGSTIRAAGNGGTINVAFDERFLPDARMSGLIE